MNRQTNKRVWLLLGLAYSITAHGACDTVLNSQGIREIITQNVIPAVCESNSILDTCCPTIADDFRSTWTVLERIESKADTLCSPCQATPITAAQTITNAGTYCLAQDIAGDIAISAPNVTLDLNGHTIAGSTNGIFIDSIGTNAWVKNGTIKDASESGIKINAPRCVIETIDTIDTPTGFLLENTSTTMLTNCRALNNSSAGFSLASGNNNVIKNCQALNPLGSANVYGFFADNGSGNSFQTCQASGAKTAATDAQYRVGGFILGETAVNDSIIGCQVADIQAPGLAQALGIASLETATTTHTVKNNVVRRVTNADVSGIGISVSSTTNYVAQNTSCDNDINYASVDPLFLKSQANARGVANVDCSLSNIPEPIIADFSTTYTMLAAVAQETWSIESKAEVISSKIDFIPSQQPIERGTVIRTPLASQVITQPGSYFLPEDIVGTVTISSNLVTLDLNGFTVQGNIVINPAVHNVVIKRGTVTTENTRASIAIAGIDNATIILDDLVITGTAYGVLVGTEGLSLASTTTNLVITRCTFSGQTAAGISNQTTEKLNPLNGLHIADCYFDASVLTAGGAVYLTATDTANPNTNLEICNSTFITNQTGIYCEICENGAIHDCSFKGFAGAATSEAVLCLTCDHFVIKNCVAATMAHEGFNIETCSNISLRECHAQGTRNGFLFSQIENLTCDQCQAVSCDTGFSLLVAPGEVKKFTISNCLASKNSADGFHSEIHINGQLEGIIIGCKAVGNGGYGFSEASDSAPINITYVNNVARGNTLGNYSTTGAPFNPASLIDEPTYWQNVTQ